jgi:hypothetical protein
VWMESVTFLGHWIHYVSGVGGLKRIKVMVPLRLIAISIVHPSRAQTLLEKAGSTEERFA